MALPFLFGAFHDAPKQPRKVMTEYSISGETSVRIGTLVRLSASGVPDTHVMGWAVSGPHRVSRADTRSNVCQWTAPPGTYTVALGVWPRVGTADAATVTTEVTIVDDRPAPVIVRPPAPKGRVVHAKDAVVRVQFGGNGSTGVPILTGRDDGRVNVLTAAHCVPDGVEVGRLILADGSTHPLSVVVFSATSDWCWCVTDQPLPDLPRARMSAHLPAKGERVQHGGFGIDRPGNLESGTVTVPENGEGQTQYRLSVSSGDSGGPIWDAETGAVYSVVCCTTEMGKEADVWGASAARIRAGLPARYWLAGPFAWTPMPVPLRAAARNRRAAGEWPPADLPTRR